MTDQTQQEQAAPVDWQAIAQQRERELKTVGEARHRAEAEVKRLRAGEEDGYDPACLPTPGQWIKRYSDATAEERIVHVTRLTRAAEQGHACLMGLHEERVQEGREALATVRRVRALRDSWLCMTLEPGQVRRLLDEVGHALDGEQP